MLCCAVLRSPRRAQCDAEAGWWPPGALALLRARFRALLDEKVEQFVSEPRAAADDAGSGSSISSSSSSSSSSSGSGAGGGEESEWTRRYLTLPGAAPSEAEAGAEDAGGAGEALLAQYQAALAAEAAEAAAEEGPAQVRTPHHTTPHHTTPHHTTPHHTTPRDTMQQ
jgi:hypothetical protein